jgi:methyl-accepting chemotaxis protein
VIQQVYAQSEHIGGIPRGHAGISEQTNLLALNSAIEAARAGEWPRICRGSPMRFGTLASRTNQSTQEINTMISELQRAILGCGFPACRRACT